MTLMPGGRLGLGGPPLTVMPGGRFGRGPPLTLIPGGRFGRGPPVTVMPGGSRGASFELRPTEIPSFESLSMSAFVSDSSDRDTWIPNPANLSMPEDLCADLQMGDVKVMYQVTFNRSYPESAALPIEIPGGKLGAGG